MHKVTVNGQMFSAMDGELLSEVLIREGIEIEHLCGGNGKCRKCLVSVNGKEELSCKYVIGSDIDVICCGKGEISSEIGIDIGKNGGDLCLALDIGTTTLALAMVSRNNGDTVAVKTAVNPQRKFGADVISRIEYCRKNGPLDLHKTIIEAVNDLIAELSPPGALTMFVSGNATMLHLFFNVDCSSMGEAPYAAQFLSKREAVGKKLGITSVDKVIALPSVHAFVGADIVAGINCVGMPSKDRYSLLVDLGTNAEIALFSDDRAVATAAAAGPCFEGANISCGMSATAGAITSCSIENGEVRLKTISDEKPIGICGTGLIDVVSELIKNGVVDETGYMEDEKYYLSEEVYITQNDIRQYQLAKSAIFSAIVSLLDVEGIEFDRIENLYISGGFSAQINLENAVFSGLFPKELLAVCTPINNSSLKGTVRFALENNDLQRIVQRCEYIDLSSNRIFSDNFILNMMFELE